MNRDTKTYELLAADIRALGVEAAFGLMSDDTALFVTALEASGIRFYSCRHENNAVVMAEGYAAASDRVGVAVIGRGPGGANCVNAAIHASRTGAATLIITGASPQGPRPVNSVGPDYKHCDIDKLFAAAGLETFTATTAESARSILNAAYTAASAGHAVTLHLPINIQLSPADSSPIERAGVAPKNTEVRKAARPQAVEAAAAVLRSARRPLILAGHGAFRSGAKDVLVQLAQKAGALLITSLRAKDLFRGNPFDLGVAGSFSHSVARRHLDQVDSAIVVGAGLNLLTSSFGDFLPPVPLIQIDTQRDHIGRYCYADVALIGDAKTTIEQLLQILPERSTEEKPFHSADTLAKIAAFRHSQDYQEAHTEWSVDMRSLALELDRLLPFDRNVVFDMGNFFAIAPYISVPNPSCLRYTGDFGSIGLGFGTALGVAAARPGRPIILFIGDGSLLMTLGELETMAREDLPMVIIVLNDNAYGAERHFLELREQPFGKSVFPAIDFAPLAANLGIESHTVRSMADLSCLAEVLRSPTGPVLVDCKINPVIGAPFLSEFARLEGH